jgi:hypothetical protein
MEGQHNLVGPQRPSAHGRLFASLPITRNLISATRESRSARLGLVYSPPQARRPPGTQTLKPSLSNGQMSTPTRDQGATSQSWPTSIGMSGCAGSEAPVGFLEIRNAIAMPAAGDRSVVTSARLGGGTTAPCVLTIWIVRAWHWLNHAVASSAERG